MGLGELKRPPTIGRSIRSPRAPARAGALYRAQAAMHQGIDTEFVCRLDGGEDVLLPGFEESIERRIADMQRTGAAIGYADELQGNILRISGDFNAERYLTRPNMLHHGVICRTEAVQALTWPEGCHWFEAICYGQLALQGWVYDRVTVYQWNPTPGGAASWHDTGRARINSLRWLQGQKGLHFKADFE